MSMLCRSSAVQFAGRAARLLLTLAMLPAVVLSPLSAEAIVLHNHPGRDLHFHTVTPNDPKDYPGSWGCELEADRQADELPKDDCKTIVLVLGLPNGLMRVSGPSTDTFKACGPEFTPRVITATASPDTGDPSLYKHPWALALSPHAGRMVASILLSNHALLL